MINFSAIKGVDTNNDYTTVSRVMYNLGETEGRDIAFLAFVLKTNNLSEVRRELFRVGESPVPAVFRPGISFFEWNDEHTNGDPDKDSVPVVVDKAEIVVNKDRCYVEAKIGETTLKGHAVLLSELAAHFPKIFFGHVPKEDQDAGISPAPFATF